MKNFKITIPKCCVFIFVVVFIFVFLIKAGLTAASERRGIIFGENFNKSVKLANKFIVSGNFNAAVTRTSSGDSPSVRMWLNPFVDKVTYRSELVPFTDSKDLQKQKFAYLGREYWYGIRIYIPKNWEIDQGRQIILQWHDQPDVELKEDWRSPPIELNIGHGDASVGKNYLLFVRSDPRRFTPPKGTKNRYEKEKRFVLGSIESDMGKWVQWVFHIKWSYSNDGYLTIWKNGKVVLELPHYPNTFNDKYGPYWKFGIYKWEWRNRALPKNTMPRVIYYDDIYIGNRQALYNDVIAFPK